ncbi:MAG: T9SS type A sorting domain-containing protein, partial [Bacteroidota bacterium]
EFVQIPLASFIDSGAGANDGVDLSQVLNVVFVFGGLPGGLEFAVSFDELGFVSGMPDTSEETATSTLSGFALSAAYPNPFQSTATFTLEMDRSEAVRVEVFDVLGRQVAVLNDGVLSAQTHTFQIDARGLSSGLYLYRATGESFSATRRVVLQD